MQKIVWILCFLNKTGLFGFRQICSQMTFAELKKSCYFIVTVHKYFLLAIWLTHLSLNVYLKSYWFSQEKISK